MRTQTQKIRILLCNILVMKVLWQSFGPMCSPGTPDGQDRFVSFGFSPGRRPILTVTERTSNSQRAKEKKEKRK